jgi:polysaccharide chain length determinant protein (PEP-CTERM system associated)
MDPPGITSTSLRDFLHVIFKRKVEILIFFGVTFCTVALATLLMKPTYEAASQILVKLGRENLYLPTVPSGANSNPVIAFNNREEQINSEIEILKSRVLAEEVVKSLGPTTIYQHLGGGIWGVLSGLFLSPEARQSPVEQAVLKLEKALEVEGVKKSDVIDIRFRHKDPEIAASVVNDLVKVYLDRHVQIHKTPQSYGFFQEQSQVLSNKLTQAERELEAFKKQNEVTALDEQRSLLLKQEADLRAALNQSLSQEAETRNRMRELRRQLAETPKTLVLDEEVDHNPFAVSTLKTRLVELELKEKDLLTKYTEQSRLVQNVKDEIQMVRSNLAEQEARQYGKTRSGVNTTYQKLQEALLQNEAELTALSAKGKTQTTQLADCQKGLDRLNKIEAEFSRLQREVDVDRQNYRLYLTKFEESRVSDAMDTEKIANVSLIEPARPPLKPVIPKPLLNMVLAVFLGAFGGLGLAFFLEYLDDSLEKVEDVENYLQVPVLASIPIHHPQQVTERRERSRFLLPARVVVPASILLVAALVLVGYLQLNRRVEGLPLPHGSTPTPEAKSTVTAHEPPAHASAPVPVQAAMASGKDAAKPVPDVKPVEDPSPGQQGAEQTVSAAPPEEKTEDAGKENVVIQVGVFREKPNAEKLLKRLRGKGYDAYLETRAGQDQEGPYWVRLQTPAGKDQAREIMAWLKKEEGIKDSFILNGVGGQ